MNIPFALNLIVLGKEHTICVLMVNATRCLNTIVEPNVLYLSFTCFKTLQIETCTSPEAHTLGETSAIDRNDWYRLKHYSI